MERTMYAFLLPAIFLLSTSSLVFAESGTPIQPQLGKWSMTTKMPGRMPSGMTASMAARMKQLHGVEMDPKAGTMTRTYCLNKANLDRWQEFGWPRHRGFGRGYGAMVGPQPGMGASQGRIANRSCGEPKYSSAGNALVVDRICSGPKTIAIHTVYTFSPQRDSYTFEQTVKMDGQELERHMTGSAKRVGGC